MPGEATPPEELVARILQGERDAEASLVERYGRGVHQLLRHRVGRDDLADDLYQETFRLALEKIRRGEVRQAERLPAFLGGLARNLARDSRRRAWRQTARQGGEDEPAAVPDPAPGPLGTLLRRERERVVRSLLEELPTPRDRQLLFRAYLSEEDKATICEDLDLSPEHYHRVLHRARQRYRALVLEHLGAQSAGRTGEH